MVRVGRTPEGTWYVGRGAGRGVWWCDEVVCEGSLQVNQVARALRAAVDGRELADLRSLRAVSGFN